MNRVLVVVGVVVSLVGLSAVAVAASEHSTGLDRALEATAQGLEKAQGRVAEAKGQQNRAKGLGNAGNLDELTGLERAAQAIDDALARGNGRGNAFGHGHAAAVHGLLLVGESPSQIAGEHGEAVQSLVHAFNELGRQQRSDES